MNLGSVNFLLAGTPKVWFCVPPAYYRSVVDLVSELFVHVPLVRSCPQAVMHKQFLIHPDTLRARGIPVSRIVQRPGDLIMTAPGAFHFGACARARPREPERGRGRERKRERVLRARACSRPQPCAAPPALPRRRPR